MTALKPKVKVPPAGTVNVVTQEGSRHFGEGRLDQVQPRAVLGGMDVLEAARTARQVRHGFFGDVGAVVVQHYMDPRFAGVVRIESLRHRSVEFIALLG